MFIFFVKIFNIFLKNFPSFHFRDTGYRGFGKVSGKPETGGMTSSIFVFVGLKVEGNFDQHRSTVSSPVFLIRLQGSLKVIFAFRMILFPKRENVKGRTFCMS